MAKKITDVDIVRDLINKELKMDDKISKHYIIELIKDVFTPTHLYNKVIGNGEKRSDGPQPDGGENIRIGANKLFRDCVRCLALTKEDYDKNELSKKEFIFGKDNYIRHNQNFKPKESQYKIIDFVPDDEEGISQSRLQKLFCETITDERAISQWDAKFENDNRKLKKAGKPLKKKSDTSMDERIKKGKHLAFTRLLTPMKKVSELETNDKGNLVKTSKNPLIAAKRAIGRLDSANLELLKKWLKVS